MADPTFPVLLRAVVINSTNNAIRMTENGVTQTVSIAAGTYFLREDYGSDDLCLALTTALNTHTGGTNTYLVSVVLSVDPAAPSGTVSISLASGSHTFALLFSNVLTTFDEALIGFSDSDTATNTAAKTSTLSPSALWVGPETPASFELGDEADVAVSRAKSGKIRGVKRSADHVTRTMVLEGVDGRRVWEEQRSSDPDATFQRFRKDVNDGTRFEVHLVPLGTYPALITTYGDGSYRIGTAWHLGPGIAALFKVGENVDREEPGLALYAWSLDLMAYVA